MRVSQVSRHFKENGCYATVIDIYERIAARIRGRILYGRLRAKNLRLGPRAVIRGICCIEIGEGFWAGEGLWLEALTRYNTQQFSPKIRIGRNVCFSQRVHIAATNYVEIGDDVLFGSKVIITDHNHGYYSEQHTSPMIAPGKRPLDFDRRFVIGSKVWLCDGVVVTPGSEVGEGAVVGANSVVCGVISPFTVSAGVPAKVIKRFDFNQQRWVGAQ